MDFEEILKEIADDTRISPEGVGKFIQFINKQEDFEDIEDQDDLDEFVNNVQETIDDFGVLEFETEEDIIEKFVLEGERLPSFIESNIDIEGVFADMRDDGIDVVPINPGDRFGGFLVIQES